MTLHRTLTVRGISSLALLTLALAISGCRPAPPPSKPLAELTPTERRGYMLFQTHCSECHYANTQQGKDGPGLQALYKEHYLPSGAPANDDRVVSVIRHGRGIMPAFGDDFDEQQLGDLLAYLHTL